MVNRGKSMPHVFVHRKLCVTGLCLRNYALGTRSRCPLCKQARQAASVSQSQTAHTNKPYRKKMEKVPQDQSHAKPPTTGVLKSLVSCLSLTQTPSTTQKFKHAQNTGEPQGHIEGLSLECFFPVKPLTELVETLQNKAQ